MASGQVHERYLAQYPVADAWNWTTQAVSTLHKIFVTKQFDNTYLNDDWATYKNNNTTVEVTVGMNHQQTHWTIIDGISKTNDKQIISMAPYAWGNYAATFTYKNITPTKLFSCFIKRTDPIRQSWFYSFVRHCVLDQSNVSFWSENPEHSDLDPSSLFEKFYNGFEIWEHEHKWIQQNLSLPFVNFSSDLAQATVDAQKSLVIESQFSDNDLVLFSEKTFRAAQLPRPFLLFGNSGSINVLRQVGFDVYDDYVDHSYDECSNWIDRQQMILQQLLNPIQYTNNMLEDFQQRAEHNYKILVELKNKWPEHLVHTCEQAKGIE